MNRLLLVASMLFLAGSVLGIFLIFGTSTSSSITQFKSILNLTDIQNIPQIVNAIQNGTSYYTDFNITYYGSASVSINPLYPIKFSAILSISRSGDLLKVYLNTANPNLLLGQQSASEQYESVSEYNGTGFLLCTSSGAPCQYNRAMQTGNFSAEIASSLSNLFSSKFLSLPYLTIMNNSYVINNSTSFIFSYLNLNNYNGNRCTNLMMSSTQEFISTSGFDVNGQLCFSNAIGLPLYGRFIVTYNGVAIPIYFNASLMS